MLSEPLTFNDLPDTMSVILLRLNVIESLLLKLANKDLQQQQHSPLTISEAAEFLHLSVQTIYQRVSNSTIPHSKKGNRLYFDEKELKEWILSGRQKTCEQIEKDTDNFLSAYKKNRM